jgi:outer membrane protein assembly factor BamB
MEGQAVKYLRLVIRVGVLLSVIASASGPAGAQWPQFRGPNGSGVDAEGTGYPITFSPTRRIVWKARAPYGQSSPVVAGGRVYLTASEGGRLLTLALDAASGRELWRRDLSPERPNKIYKANDPASPTPVADADGVIVFFPDFGLAAYDRDGKDRWNVPLGPFKSFYGLGTSPVVSEDVVALVCDQASGSFLLAVDRKTGRELWKKDRPGAIDAYATPMMFRPVSGPPQLIVLGSTRVDSYALATGERNWWLPIGSVGAMGTALTSGDTVFVTTMGTSEPWMPTFEATLEKLDKDKDKQLSPQEFSADKEMGEHFGFLDNDGDGLISATDWNYMRGLGRGEFGAIAIRASRAKGQLDAKSVAWRFSKNLPYIPAPLLYKGVFYMVKDGGIITALDAATGKPLKEGRSPKAIGEYHASPVAAEDKIYIANVDGVVSVLKAGAQWEVLSVNDIGEPIHATPALSGGRLYVRTKDALYCFGGK